MSTKHVMVAMSGGVDSSVAAFLLREAGYRVSGAHMQLHDNTGRDSARVTADLEETCRLLGIPLYWLDFREVFQREIIGYFCREYSLGRTPNPCVLCNQRIKFGRLLKEALAMGADYLATGHYARVESTPGGNRLLRARCKEKDQSYFLYRLGQYELGHLIFPVSELSKAQVRRLAGEKGLPAIHHRESQDVCFIPDNDYRSFISKYVPSQSGEIVNRDGTVLGHHNGLDRYTIGQRQGLGLGSEKRLYVIELDAEHNRLVVGGKEGLLASNVLVRNLSWVSGEEPEEGEEIAVKIRYHSEEVAAHLYIKDNSTLVHLSREQAAITPGQSIVFYRGDEVLGGGIIVGKVN